MIRLIANYFALVVICPIFLFWLCARVRRWLVNDKKKNEMTYARWQERNNSHNDKAIHNVYLGERQEWYEECKILFNELMKDGQLSRHELLYLKGMINRLLGGYVDHYKGFKWDKDKRELHEIYVKLKSQHLDRSDFAEIKGYLEECRKVVKVKREKSNVDTKEKEGKVV